MLYAALLECNRGGDTECGDDGYLSAHEVCCQAGQCVELPLSEGGLDGDVLALHDVNFLESLPDRLTIST
jgi:hypothetical protein